MVSPLVESHPHAKGDSTVPRYARSVAIFASRESSHTLTLCVRAVFEASESVSTLVDVLVNGNRALADDVARELSQLKPLNAPTTVRVWFIPLGDKAHAWNEYVHRLCGASKLHFFIDGYTLLHRDSLDAIDEGLASDVVALAASGVPTDGPSAHGLRNQMVRDGGIHGNLHALRGSTLAAIRANGIRLPLGIYRTDSLIGAVICFALDPARFEWDRHRIRVQQNASWSLPIDHWWASTSLQTRFKRMLRQAQGRLENCAIHDHLALKKRAPESLPVTAREMVDDWLSTHHKEALSLFVKHPLTGLAVRRLRRARTWTIASLSPILIVSDAE